MSKSFPRQLLDQAGLLVRKEKRRPQQANLRRAVSAAYYALFHFLIDEACRSVVGATHQRQRLRRVLARAFKHGTMKSASKTFATGQLPSEMRTKLHFVSVPKDFQRIADWFVMLQEERHRVDYDLASPFTRQEAIRLVNTARDCLRSWNNVKTNEAARLYLISLMVRDQMKGK